MDFDAMIVSIGAQNDQDAENLAQWMRDSDNGELIKLWMMMNETYPNPYTEAMTRFAIYGFALTASKVFGQEATDVPE